MRILLLTPNFRPEKTGIGVSATETALILSELGHEVQVVTSVPYYPEWEVPPAYRRRLVFEERLDGVRVTRLARYVPRRPRTVNRILHELSLGLHATARTFRRAADLVLCISPPLVLAFFSVLVAALRRRPLWLYVQDIQPDAAVELGMIGRPSIVATLRWMERIVYRRAERILVLSEEMAHNVRQKLPSDHAKVGILPLAVPARELAAGEATAGRTRMRRRLGAGDRFVVLYSGNLGVKHEPEILVDCALRSRENPDLFFAVVGTGARRRQVEERIAAHGLDNIRLFPLVEEGDYRDLLAAADTLVVLLRREAADVVMPSKILSYLASGRPVVAAMRDDTTLARRLARERAGLVVAPGDAVALGEAIDWLRSHREEASCIGRRGRRLVCEEYDEAVVRERYYRPLFGPD